MDIAERTTVPYVSRWALNRDYIESLDLYDESLIPERFESMDDIGNTEVLYVKYFDRQHTY